MNFTQLQTEIATWLNRSDLTSYIPTWIRQAQWDLEHGIPINGVTIPNRGLWASMRVLTTGGTLTDGTETLAYPTRYRETRSFMIYYGYCYYRVEQQTYEFVRKYWPSSDVILGSSHPSTSSDIDGSKTG